MDPPTELAETHVSIVFFVGDRAYKLKKPVRTGFLDFTTREAREAVCRHEVELNRRLAPDVYLGVSSVLDVDGSPCDTLVVMRRLPEELRLSTLATRGDDLSAEIRDIARTVAAFHARAETGPEIDASATAEAVLRNWDDNFTQMKPFRGGVLPSDDFDRLAELAHDYVEGRRPLFARRIEDGHVVDGHGDLLADDIFCLPDGPRILDCIEFDDRLRYADVLADVTFLAMDLEFLRRPDAVVQLYETYAEFAGERHPESLAHHYTAYRAHVRSKVACLRHEQGIADAAGQARRLHAIALEHLLEATPTLVVVGGSPGTGKSTLATGIAATRDWVVLRSDVIRKERAGLPSSEPAPAEYREGLYRPEATDATYEEMLRRARRLLEVGESVILDASWAVHRHRREAQHTADATRSTLVELRCVAPADLAAQRIGTRAARGGGSSDATPTVAEAMARDTDPWPGAVELDTTGSPSETLRAAARAIATTRAGPS